MLRLLSFISFFTLISCQQDTKLEGMYDMTLSIQGKEVPFFLKFKGNNKVDLINGAELIPLEYELNENIITIPILNFDASINLKIDGRKLFGSWKRPTKIPPYDEPIFGMKTNASGSLSKVDLPKKWKMIFTDGEKKSEAILLFTDKDGGSYASVLTPTGDYRFLNPTRDGDKLLLRGFDGIFSFYFEGTLKGETYTGKMFSGKNWNQDFSAEVNESFELPDPTEATKFQGKIENLELSRLDGSKDKLISSADEGKVKVIQIFGSWCPNCIDETRFIKEWRTMNSDKNVSFSMISFERSPNKKHAIKMIKKAKELHGIDYPIFIGGYSSDDKVEAILPGIENFISFPTTLFVDKKNKIRKIHAGFSGPATGKYYEKFILDFNSMIDKLLAE